MRGKARDDHVGLRVDPDRLAVNAARCKTAMVVMSDPPEALIAPARQIKASLCKLVRGTTLSQAQDAGTPRGHCG